MNLAIDWINATEAQLNSNPISPENEDAIIRLFELCSHYPDNALQVILTIIQQMPEDRVLYNLGAGPIESLLFKYPSYLGQLISMTPNVNNLKKSLSYVNYDDEDELDIEMLNKFLSDYS